MVSSFVLVAVLLLKYDLLIRFTNASTAIQVCSQRMAVTLIAVKLARRTAKTVLSRL
jgi:hypothetical protein